MLQFNILVPISSFYGVCKKTGKSNILSSKRIMLSETKIWYSLHFIANNYNSIVKEIYIIIPCCHHIVVCVNIIPSIFFSRFRQGFKQFFSFVPCINVRTNSLIRREVVTSRYSYSGSPDAHYRIVRNGNRKPGRRNAFYGVRCILYNW